MELFLNPETPRLFLTMFYATMVWLSLGFACTPHPKSPTQRSEKVAQITPGDETLVDSTKIHYLTGRFDPDQHPDFVLIPSEYADRAGLYLRQEALEAFIKMNTAAKKDGIALKIISATRNFVAQKRIWEEKWTGKRPVTGTANILQIKDPVKRAELILLYSSMPGTSRHHWGTDVDLNALNNEYFTTGAGLKTYQWLLTHAADYGFCQPYNAGRVNGYQEEKWHWSYLPVSIELTAYATQHLRDQDITGFLGAETAAKIQVVEKYVLGINPACHQ